MSPFCCPQLYCLHTATTTLARKEQKALEGEWKAVSFEAGGKLLPKGAVPPFACFVHADGRAIGKSATVDYQAKLKLDSANPPRQSTTCMRPASTKARGKSAFAQAARRQMDRLDDCPWRRRKRPSCALIPRVQDSSSSPSSGANGGALMPAWPRKPRSKLPQNRPSSPLREGDSIIAGIATRP